MYQYDYEEIEEEGLDGWFIVYNAVYYYFIRRRGRNIDSIHF